MAKSKGANRLFPFLVVMMIEFAAAAIFLPIQHARLAAAIERGPGFELALIAEEARVDLASFARDIAAYRLDPSAQRASAVQADYTALAARRGDFSRGDFGPLLASDAKARSEADAFEQAIARLDPLVADLGGGDNASNASDLAAQLAPTAQALATRALAASDATAAARRSQLRWQQFETVALNIGLLLASCGLIAILGWQNRFVRLTHLKQIETTKRYEFLANHDGLTGLPNRAHFGQALTRALTKLGARNREVALLAIDLDRFKAINDTLGHAAGDALLVFVAQRLSAVTKREPGAFAARLGGDEFLLIVEGEDLGRRVAGIAAAVLESLGRPYLLEGRSMVVGASVGIALAPRDGRDAAEIIRKSDVALGCAKTGGRGAARLFDEEMDREGQERMALETDIAESIERDEFVPHYQPVVEFATGNIIGVEALARWRHGRRGLAPPSAFINVAEETALIVDIGRRMLELSCRDAIAMPPHIHIAVNLSPVQFLRGDIVETVQYALDRSGLAASRLELEIGESVLLADENKTFEVMGKLRALGARIALDDFGTGYSSLSYLRRYGFDRLKIDRSLICEIDQEPRGFEIVQSVVALGRTLGMAVTAEGLETAEQSRMAWLAGCGYGQGFLFGRPMAAAELSGHCGWNGPRQAIEIA